MCDGTLRHTLWTSPEILVFLFFMITDPKTAPQGRVARMAYGASVGVLAVVLSATQTTEFGTKVAVLSALVLTCMLRPSLERFLPAPGSGRDSLRAWVTAPGLRRTPVERSALVGVGSLAVLVAILAVAHPYPAAVAADVVALDAPDPTAPVPVAVDVADSVDQLGIEMTDDEIQAFANNALAIARSVRSQQPARVTMAFVDTIPTLDPIEHLTVVALKLYPDPQLAPTLGLRVEGAGTDLVLAMAELDGVWYLDAARPTETVVLLE